MEIVGFVLTNFSQKRLVADTDATCIGSHIRQELVSAWVIGERGPLEWIFEHAEICSVKQAGFVTEREVVRPQSDSTTPSR